tara:strand:+ start:5678 stop:5920 length:243 start_codon:yes stop_codon:yes gene_type:complete
MVKIQESKVLSTTMVEGKEVPVIQPEVHHRIYCKNCDNEVDSDEQATGNCSNCGQAWSANKVKDIQVKVVQLPIGSGSGE